MNEQLLSIKDVYGVISEAMSKVDELYPEIDARPRKVHVIELLDGIKLRLAQRAEKNADRYQSPFEKAAAKITGHKPNIPKNEELVPAPPGPMQAAYEAAKARIKGNS